MELTTEYMRRFIGGQHEIFSHFENYRYRSQIKNIQVEDDPGQAGFTGQAANLVVEYEYCCEFVAGEGGSGNEYGFKPSENRTFTLALSIAGASEIGNGKLCVNAPVVGEMSVFYPPTHHKRVLADGKMQVEDI